MTAAALGMTAEQLQRFDEASNHPYEWSSITRTDSIGSQATNVIARAHLPMAHIPNCGHP